MHSTHACMIVSRLCPRFRSRLASMGLLNDLTLTCSDQCCEGLNNPRDHVAMKVFPALEKWPLADLFHKTQIGTDSMVAGHPLYAGACRYDALPPLLASSSCFSELP